MPILPLPFEARSLSISIAEKSAVKEPTVSDEELSAAHVPPVDAASAIPRHARRPAPFIDFDLANASMDASLFQTLHF